jgi:ABC-type protease/lipase transport system fused ATPase/permease subunit
MKIGLSFITLASAAVLAVSASAAQARTEVGKGQATTAKAQAAQAEEWYQAEAHFFEGMTRSQIQHLKHRFQHQTSHRSLRPDDRSGPRGAVTSNTRGQDRYWPASW